jgi:hypothetical protein
LNVEIVSTIPLEIKVWNGVLLKYRKKHKTDEPDWLLEQVIVLIYCNRKLGLVIDVKIRSIIDVKPRSSYRYDQHTGIAERAI